MNALVMGVPSNSAGFLRQWASAGGIGPIIVSTALILVVCVAVALVEQGTAVQNFESPADAITAASMPT